MGKIRVCVVGYGNVGKEAIECIRQAPDMELAGVVRRNPENPGLDCPVVSSVDELGKVDVAVLTSPSRQVPAIAPLYLEKGINTVDSFDIHGDPTLALKKDLDQVGKAHGSVAIISAGWDPGTDSVFRVLFAAMAPRGITYTNFGPGMSMGHTVAVKAIPGVKNALSMTLPAGFGTHKRDVYVELEDGADFAQVAEAIKKDPYFVHDETRVTKVDNVMEIEAMGHGVLLQRYGAAGTAENLVLELKTRLTNPSATAQVMVSAARASTRMKPGAYTLVEVPPIDLLPGDKDDLVKHWV
ncbi:MAG TPA: diaminopimelate dehydrogenase [Firmicutes bacterium]|nr:diaminopimelate dehydrogenase [Candidatus Fermentithermobacillaceae bacterium]